MFEATNFQHGTGTIVPVPQYKSDMKRISEKTAKVLFEYGAPFRISGNGMNSEINSMVYISGAPIYQKEIYMSKQFDADVKEFKKMSGAKNVRFFTTK